MDDKQIEDVAKGFVNECRAGSIRPNGDATMREISIPLTDRDYKVKTQQIAAWEEEIEDIRAEAADASDQLKKTTKDLQRKIDEYWMHIKMQSQKIAVEIVEHRDYDNGLIYTIRLPEWQLLEVSKMPPDAQVKLNLPTTEPDTAPVEAQSIQEGEYEDVPVEASENFEAGDLL